MPKTTPFELAQLRLQAFGLMEGWGTTNEKGVFVPHLLPRRRELASELADWALADHDAAKAAPIA